MQLEGNVSVIEDIQFEEVVEVTAPKIKTLSETLIENRVAKKRLKIERTLSKYRVPKYIKDQKREAEAQKAKAKRKKKKKASKTYK